jgi:hypothetical protein
MEYTTTEKGLDRHFFEMQLANLSLNYRQKVEMRVVNWYWEQFKKCNKEKFNTAINEIVSNEEFFPTVATIKKYMDKSKEYPEFKDDWPEFKDIKNQKTQIGRDCMKLVLSFTKDQIDREEYYKGMLELEGKYPNIQPIPFSRAAELFRGKKIQGGLNGISQTLIP